MPNTYRCHDDIGMILQAGSVDVYRCVIFVGHHEMFVSIGQAATSMYACTITL